MPSLFSGAEGQSFIRTIGDNQAIGRSVGVGGSSVSDVEDFADDESRRLDNTSRANTQSIFDTLNEVGLSDRLAENRTAAGEANENLQGQLARRQQGLGLSANMSERQKKSQGRQIGLHRAIQQEDRTNATRRGFRERREAVQDASVGLEDGLFGIQSAGLLERANAAAQKQIRLDTERANKKAARNSMIGQVVGAGISLLAMSDETKKDKRGKPANLLDKLKGVRVDRWNYKGEDEEHVGPYAQEFNDTFNVGKAHPGMINMVDVVGVALGAIKELDARTSNAN